MAPGSTSAIPGIFAVLSGRETPVVGVGTSYVWTVDKPWVDDRFARTTNAAGDRVVRVTSASLERLFRRSVTATWRGKRVQVRRVMSPTWASIFFDGDPEWASSAGLDGSQYEGWVGKVIPSELADVTVHERDIHLEHEAPDEAGPP